MKTIAIVDYGVGNLKSVTNALAYLGLNALVTGDAGEIEGADAVILPGVGAFPDAADKLRETGLDRTVLRQAGRKPILGICLGMQLLFDRSFEYGEHRGLGLVPGNVRPISEVIPADLKIPHIGWNALTLTPHRDKNCIFRCNKNGDHVYFVHSYYAADCAESVTAVTEYGAKLTAAVQNGNVYGTQFHPEKSGPVGLTILKSFCEVTP